MNETKKEREQRLNRQRVARHRLRKKLDAELQKKDEDKQLFEVRGTKEANLEILTQELQFIRDECYAEGKPLWTSKKFREWEEKMQKLADAGKLPKRKKHESDFIGITM